MTFRSLGFVAVLGAAVFAANVANASVATYTDEATWAAAAGGAVTNTTTDPRSSGTSINTITLDDGTVISLTQSLEVHRIGDGWATWSGVYAGTVYTDYFSTEIDAAITPVLAMGFEIEPDPFDLYDITLELSDGTTLTQSVQGDSGAAFFGWVGAGITSIKISSAADFAFGNFFTSGATPAPEPMTLSLVGAGLAGIGALRRRKAKA